MTNTTEREQIVAWLRKWAKGIRKMKPGGRVYLDASATRTKYDVTTFMEKYLFPGNGSPLCLHDYLTALSRSPMEVDVVLNDRRNYLLTTQRWAVGESTSNLASSRASPKRAPSG